MQTDELQYLAGSELARLHVALGGDLTSNNNFADASRDNGWSDTLAEERRKTAFPIPTPGSKTGPALKSKALRGDRSRAHA